MEDSAKASKVFEYRNELQQKTANDRRTFVFDELKSLFQDAVQLCLAV